MTVFEIEEAWIFEPGDGGRANQKPFEFVRDLFQKRRMIKEEADRAGRYDIREKTIKLPLNSIYGKLAQLQPRFSNDRARGYRPLLTKDRVVVHQAEKCS